MLLLLLVFQGGADPAGQQANELALGLIEALLARLAGGKGDGAIALAVNADQGADVTLVTEALIARVSGMCGVGHVRNGQHVVAL